MHMLFMFLKTLNIEIRKSASWMRENKEIHNQLVVFVINEREFYLTMKCYIKSVVLLEYFCMSKCFASFEHNFFSNMCE